MQPLALVPSVPAVTRQQRIVGKLSDRQIAAAKPTDKPYKLTDGNGLYVLVNPTGSKLWRWKFSYGRKEKLLAIGSYPITSLADARRARDNARRLLVSGVDPMAEKKAAKIALVIACENSFEVVAKAWWENWRMARSEQHAGQVWRRFEANVFPHIGKKPVAQIVPLDLVAMVKAIRRRGPIDLAKRALMTCSQVLSYAQTNGLTQTNAAAGIKLSEILPTVVPVHLARIDISEMPDLLRKIDGYKGAATTRLATKLLALTFVRTTELIGAKWQEFDLGAGEWRIPAERMKMRTPHFVPLARQAVNILKTLKMISGESEHLFPGERDHSTHMSNNTILKALERMGYKGRMTGHGFRGVASTHLHEQQYPSEHIELQLGHLRRNRIQAAYDWSKHLPQRRAMMQYWADFLDERLDAG